MGLNIDMIDKLSLNKLNLTKILISLGVIIFTITGCFSTDASGYQYFVMDEGAAQFSFEYNTKYKISYTKTLQDVTKFLELAVVDLIAPLNKKTKDYTSMGILVGAGNILARDAESEMTNNLKKYSTSMGFQLLEQSDITVSGVPAKLIAYKERNILPIDRGLTEPPFEVLREVYFDYNGLIWRIDIRSDSTTAEEDKADFEHVLQTFKILN